MAITYFSSFSEAKDRLESLAPSAIDTANKAYNDTTYKNALNLMRQCLENICQAIIYQKSANPTAAIEAVKNTIPQGKAKELNSLIDLISSNANEWLADAGKTGHDKTDTNRNRKSKFHSVREKGNLGSHESTIIPTYQDVEECKVNLRLIIQWFYKDIANNPTIPTTLQDAINGKPLTADQREKNAALFAYYKELKEQYTAPIPIDKNYKLSDLYIVPTETENAVKGWLNQSEKRLFLLLGDAGQGKSSFCKYLLNQQLADENNPNGLKTSIINNPTSQPICFFRLREIINVEGLTKEPIDFLYEQVCNNIDVDTQYLQKSEFYKSILILDGLDELCLLSGNDFAVGFITELLTSIKLKRYSNMLILITSRKMILGEHFISKLMPSRALEEINLGQQINWLKKYKTSNNTCPLTEEQLESFNTDGNLKHIKELLELPILLHLVALSNAKIDVNSNRTSIYKNLFDELQKRAWEDEKLKPFAKLGVDLQVIVREAAFKMHCKGSEFISKLELTSLQQANEQLKELTNVDVFQYLMLAFYTNADNQALEFLHKSLKEYLIAEKIWLDMKKIANCITAEEALNLVWDLFSPVLLSNEIQDYLTECIQADTDHVLKSTIFKCMMRFAPELLEQHFLSRKFKTGRPIDHALFTFRGYWVVLAALSNGEKNIMPLDEKSRDLFTKLLKIKQLMQFGLPQFWDLRKSDLSSLDLRNIDLRNANLAGVNLQSANLMDANLQEANLLGANLNSANLTEAYLGVAVLIDAQIMNATLLGANLEGADLAGANLRNTVLQDANLTYANLSHTIFDMEQLYPTKSLHNIKGLLDEQIAHLKEKGLGHFFENPEDYY